MFPLFTSWPLLITIVFCFHHSKINYLYIGCKPLDSINDLDFLSYFTDLQNSTVNSSLRHFPWFLEYHSLLAFMPSASCAAASLFYSFILLLFSSILFLLFSSASSHLSSVLFNEEFPTGKKLEEVCSECQYTYHFLIYVFTQPFLSHMSTLDHFCVQAYLIQMDFSILMAQRPLKVSMVKFNSSF